MPTPPADRPPVRGVLRLLNGADGRVLCLAGDVDEATVHAFTDRYGREPARVDVVDAGSATSLSAPALQLVLDHLDAAGLAGRPVAVHGSPVVQQLLADVRLGAAPPQD